MQTRLTQLLGVEHPVMLAGMGGISYSRLVAAVAEAGGYGTLGAATLTREGMVTEMQAVRRLTNRPFGVDLLVAFERDLRGLVEVAIGEGMTLFVAGLGIPAKVVDLCHDHGVLVGSMCGKVDHARAAVDAGCDLVIAQGTEAGGHTGRIGTMPLVPMVVDAVSDRVPVVAAGGLSDGRGLAAALALGADGVWMGTRFLATPEAHTVPGYKEAVLAGREDGTVITRSYSGKPMRALRNRWTDHHEAHPDEIQPFPAQALRTTSLGVMHLGGDEHAEVDPERECYPAGQVVGAIDALEPAGDLVRRIVTEAEAVLRRLGSS